MIIKWSFSLDEIGNVAKGQWHLLPRVWSCLARAREHTGISNGTLLYQPYTKSTVIWLIENLCETTPSVRCSGCRLTTTVRFLFLKDSNLVDPASSHTLVSKIKPCMSKYKRLILWNCEWLIISVIVYLIVLSTWITVVILELIHATTPDYFGRAVFIRYKPMRVRPGIVVSHSN